MPLQHAQQGQVSARHDRAHPHRHVALHRTTIALLRGTLLYSMSQHLTSLSREQENMYGCRSLTASPVTCAKWLRIGSVCWHDCVRCPLQPCACPSRCLLSLKLALSDRDATAGV